MRCAGVWGAAVLVGLATTSTYGESARPAATPPEASVLKVLATTPMGTVAYGSGVVIALEKLATNCHVVRDATRIHVMHAGRAWSAQQYAGDGEKDVCLLEVRGLPAPPVRMRSAATLGDGEAVSAIGFPRGGSLVRTEGKVETLYRFQDARIIQTSAPFEQGASGGGLFNARGELIGLLTFKAPSGGRYHFAVPTDWVLCVEEEHLAGVRAPRRSAFWERSPGERAHFLRAVWYESKRQWSELYSLCKLWARAEPDNEDVRRFIARAADGMTRVIEVH